MFDNVPPNSKTPPPHAIVPPTPAQCHPNRQMFHFSQMRLANPFPLHVFPPHLGVVTRRSGSELLGVWGQTLVFLALSFFTLDIFFVLFTEAETPYAEGGKFVSNNFSHFASLTSAQHYITDFKANFTPFVASAFPYVFFDPRLSWWLGSHLQSSHCWVNEETLKLFRSAQDSDLRLRLEGS